MSGERPTPRVNPAAADPGRGFLQPDRETVKGARRDRRGRLFAPSGKGWHRVLGQTYEGASMRRLVALFPTVRTRLVAGRWEIYEPATGFVRGRGRRPRQAIRAALHGRSGRRVKLTLEEWQKLDGPGA